jgi:hypothetical protein
MGTIRADFFVAIEYCWGRVNLWLTHAVGLAEDRNPLKISKPAPNIQEKQWRTCRYFSRRSRFRLMLWNAASVNYDQKWVIALWSGKDVLKIKCYDIKTWVQWKYNKSWISSTYAGPFLDHMTPLSVWNVLNKAVWPHSGVRTPHFAPSSGDVDVGSRFSPMASSLPGPVFTQFWSRIRSLYACICTVLI